MKITQADVIDAFIVVGLLVIIFALVELVA